jgi:hypothetical protein
MKSYKIGDKVLLDHSDYFKADGRAGKFAVIVDGDSEGYDYRIKVGGSYDYANEDELIPEYIWNSPLAKALREGDDEI